MSRLSKRHILPILFAACLLSACGGGASSTSNDPADADLPPVTTLAAGVTQTANLAIDQYIQGQLVEQRIPGVTLVVVDNGTVVYAKGYGYANVESARPVRPEDRFEIGSITKSFAASALMLLVEEGKIALSDTLDKYIDGLPLASRAITIRQLLSHTAGIVEFPDTAYYTALRANQGFTEEASLAQFIAYPLRWQPGSAYGYSNVGFDLVGILIHKVSGKPYFDFLRERIFTPLGMSSVRQIAPQLSAEGFATGYEIFLNHRRAVKTSDAELSYLGMAASGIQVSAMDMAKWDAALYTERILKKSSLDLMWTNQALVQAANADSPDIYYGLGWQLRVQNGNRWVYHSGGMPGHVTEFMRYPDHKMTIIVLTNLDDQHANARKIVRAVSQIINPAL